MRSSALVRVVGLARGWACLYTRGLPADLQTERRAELDSDLWEHEQQRVRDGYPPGRVAFEILARLVAGMPADLSWRLEHAAQRERTLRRSGGETITGAFKGYGMTALAAALGAWALAVVPIIAGSAEWIQGAVSAVFGLLIWGGLIAMHRGRRGGRAAVALGAVGAGFLVVWIVLPAIVAAAVLVWLVAGRREVGPAPPQPV